MALFTSITDGWHLFEDSWKAMVKKPILIAPLIFAWIIIAALIISVSAFVRLPNSPWLLVVYAFVLLFLISLIICLANMLMLEFMEEIELGHKKLSPKRAFSEVGRDFLKIVPVASVWCIAWLMIWFTKLWSKKGRKKSAPNISPRDAADSLAGEGANPLSWWHLGLDMFEKLLRMYIFLTLPAIAWENKDAHSAFKKSTDIIRRHPIHFLTTFTLTGITSLFMVVPLIIVLALELATANFPPIFWVIVIIYEAIVWTLGVYLEQLSVGLLYLWYFKWEKKGSKGELTSVSKPDLLDNIHELK
jgi:hypothetical protein